MTVSIEGIEQPDSKLGRAGMEFVRDMENGLPFNQFDPGLLIRRPRGPGRSLKFDPEWLYTGAVFHDIGLIAAHSIGHGWAHVDALPTWFRAGQRRKREGVGPPVRDDLRRFEKATGTPHQINDP